MDNVICLLWVPVGFLLSQSSWAPSSQRRIGGRRESGLLITVDGPAAAGKSTVARVLADRLGFDYLDTGAMYRSVTWKVMHSDVDISDPSAVAEVAAQTEITFTGDGAARRVKCDGEDVTEAIRTVEVTGNIFHVADEPEVRKALIARQREIGQRQSFVAEGRDQGTDVFPDAGVKFFLHASLEERARRRLRDLRATGCKPCYEEVLAQIVERDRQDSSRPVGALRKTEDMVVIDSTNLSADEVVDRMVDVVARRCPGIVGVHGENE